MRRTLLVSGDDKVVAETRSYLGNIEGAVAKWAIGFHWARTLTPERANEVIRDGVKRALARIGEFKPYKVKASLSGRRACRMERIVPIVENTHLMRRMRAPHRVRVDIRRLAHLTVGRIEVAQLTHRWPVAQRASVGSPQ